MDFHIKIEKVKIDVEREVVNELIKLKKVGDSYSDIIKRLLNGEHLTK